MLWQGVAILQDDFHLTRRLPALHEVCVPGSTHWSPLILSHPVVLRVLTRRAWDGPRACASSISLTSGPSLSKAKPNECRHVAYDCGVSGEC